MGPFLQSINQPCHPCFGRGVHGANEQIQMVIDVPRGIDHGTRIVKGDITFVVNVASHPVFTRRGNLLVWKRDISFEESVTGILLVCPHINGNLEIDTGVLWGVIDPRKEYEYQDVVIVFDVKYPSGTMR